MTAGRAAVVEESRDGAAPAARTITVADVEYAEPGHGEVLVRLTATGLCHTDLGVLAGGIPFPAPGIIGHEGAGRVESVGPGVRGVSPGDAVLLSFTSCGACASCTAAHPAYCETWLPRNLLGGIRDEDSGGLTRDGESVAASSDRPRSGRSRARTSAPSCVSPTTPTSRCSRRWAAGC